MAATEKTTKTTTNDAAENETVKAKVKAKAKTKKVVKKEKTIKKTRRSRGSALAEGKIKLLAKENPKRQGSKAWKRFELYKKHHTVAAYLEAGGKQSSLRYDEKHEHIKITDKKTKAELKEKSN